MALAQWVAVSGGPKLPRLGSRGWGSADSWWGLVWAGITMVPSLGARLSSCPSCVWITKGRRAFLLSSWEAQPVLQLGQRPSAASDQGEGIKTRPVHGSHHGCAWGPGQGRWGIEGVFPGMALAAGVAPEAGQAAPSHPLGSFLMETQICLRWRPFHTSRSPCGRPDTFLSSGRSGIEEQHHQGLAVRAGPGLQGARRPPPPPMFCQLPGAPHPSLRPLPHPGPHLLFTFGC